MNRAAQAISLLFHPILFPLMGLIVIFNSGIYISELAAQYKLMILLLTALCTVIMPLIILPALIFLRHIESFQMDARRERLIPLFFTTVCFFSAHLMMHKFLGGVSIFSLYLLSATFVVLVLLAFILFWKISLHTAGAGGMLGLIAVLSIRFSLDMTFVASSALIITGMIFSARMVLKAHSLAQLIIGFLTGFTIISVLLSFYFR